ncbi:MAG TPA: hypothetical protein PKD25_05685, partial [Rubrivivax sp.]|nr:hypothetical protein [Rubrivivax sp.]
MWAPDDPGAPPRPGATHRTRIKICGLTREADVDAAADAGAGAPRWSLVARAPASGEAELERLELNAYALTVAANGAVDQQTLEARA